MPTTLSRPPEDAITGIILAGGLGTRMGGADKGLQLHHGKALVCHVAARLAPQVARLMINANRNQSTYATFGYPLVADHISGFAGPLAGLHAALSTAHTPLVVTAPCDSPDLPYDLVDRLYQALRAGPANLAIARTAERIHPVFCLCHRSLLPQLTAYLEGGGRRVAAWCAAMGAIEVDFSDQGDAFGNFNTLDDLAGH
ncbi:molybdenum cofactor guanylyltransferase MobA [Dechloromonas sp. HYN0024]|uniref:molybdenum cofactor guanylyltransferase MobA n=1 Tax=Dechloromonas sp. HYN0024 TaxID=2231055 RepID=UPI000E43C204|nr:molybdenum cofactor guanylyltransferase MobA [Dechloromonas sp. HYN0024]AXS81126.1 molybdenum cofactor guanylyltransferase [Dechloromonas sp. HYN0024]